VFYEVQTKQVSRSIGNIDIGGNPSADGGGEDGDEGVEDGAVTVNNLVDAHKLVETAYDKKAYTSHIKAYLKKIIEKKEEAGGAGFDKKAFQEAAQKAVVKILSKFDDYAFYTGESMDPEAMVPLKFYKEDGITPYFLFWKDGMREEKY